MTSFNPTRPDQTSLTSHLSSAARSVLGNRFGLLAIAAGVIGLSAYTSWGWLVAVGLAPILLALAPCAAMCALGMCMKGGKSKNTADVAVPNLTDGTDAKLPFGIAAPGAIEGTFSVLNQPTPTKPSTKKGCC